MLWCHRDSRPLVPGHGVCKRWGPLRLCCCQGVALWVRSKQILLSNNQCSWILAWEWYMPQRFEARKHFAWQWGQSQDSRLWVLSKISEGRDFRYILWDCSICGSRISSKEALPRILGRHLELWHPLLCNGHRWYAICTRKCRHTFQLNRPSRLPSTFTFIAELSGFD